MTPGESDLEPDSSKWHPHGDPRHQGLIQGEIMRKWSNSPRCSAVGPRWVWTVVPGEPCSPGTGQPCGLLPRTSPSFLGNGEVVAIVLGHT